MTNAPLARTTVRDRIHGQRTVIATTDRSGKDSQATFVALLERHRGIVRKVATTYCRDAHDRADLSQEIAAHLWQAWPRYDPERSFSTWMYRVALNVALSHVRGAYRRAAHFAPLEPEHDEIAGAPVDHAIEQSLSVLRDLIDGMDGMNRALLLLYLEDRSHREIADILGLSETNVGTKIGRLKERLRARIAGSKPGEPR